MNVSFTSNEIQELFDFALHNRQSEAAGLALKIAKITNADAAVHLSAAVEKSELMHFALVNGLAQFARYDQIEMIQNLLDVGSAKTRLLAIDCLGLLKDPVSLKRLDDLARSNEPDEIKKKAKLTFDKISENPIPLSENNFYTLKNLPDLLEEDLCYADFILSREFTSNDVNVLVNLLSHPVPNMRELAEYRLNHMEKAQAKTVIDTILTLKAPINREIISVLAHLRHPEGAALIIKWLESKTGYEDYGATEALGSIGGREAALYLLNCVVTKDYSSIEERALEKITSPPIPEFILEYENNEQFRRKGGKILARTIGIHALPVLLTGIQGRYREIRINAHQGLAQLGKPATEGLLNILLSTNDENVKLEICDTLCEIRDSRSLTAFEKLTEAGSKTLRLAALKAIGKINNPSAFKILSEFVEGADDEMRILSIKGIGCQTHPDSIGILIKQSKDKNKYVQLAVITSLYKLIETQGDEKGIALKVLLDALSDPNEEVAELAENYLVDLAKQSGKILDDLKDLARNVYQIVKSRIGQDRKIYARRHVACMAEMEPIPPSIEIPNPITDTIQFAASAPQSVRAKSSFILDIWAYFESFRIEVNDLARRAQRDEAIMLRTKGPVKVKRDTTLDVKIEIPEFKVYQEDTIYWGGSTGNCTFKIKVPAKAGPGYYIGTANFLIGSFLIAKLNFDIKVGELQSAERNITTKLQRVKTAFASYASEERNKVLGRVQGMLKLFPQLDIFLDVASLRSGDKWEERLESEIKNRDVFYLFWSSAASKSVWVEKEWKTALLLKGIDSIDPIPLESPASAPPPIELSSLHFNDWTLAFETNPVSPGPNFKTALKFLSNMIRPSNRYDGDSLR